jgi:hypothetical protein
VSEGACSLKKLDGFSFHIGFRPTQIGISPNQADDGRPSLCPQDRTKQRVAAELRSADDKLMTTQVVVGSGLIPYEPDIVDQYFEKPARRVPFVLDIVSPSGQSAAF